MKLKIKKYTHLSTFTLSNIKGGKHSNLRNIIIESGLPIGWNWYRKQGISK